MRRPVVPILSGNTRYIGLSVPEWCLVGLATCFFMVFLRVPFLTLLFIETPIIVLYSAIFSKMEENILFVLRASHHIPNILYGAVKKPLPLHLEKEVRIEFGNNPHAE